jgi:hypothetical protein
LVAVPLYAQGISPNGTGTDDPDDDRHIKYIVAAKALDAELHVAGSGISGASVALLVPEGTPGYGYALSMPTVV